jgi:hypothetical protein
LVSSGERERKNQIAVTSDSFSIRIDFVCGTADAEARNDALTEAPKILIAFVPPTSLTPVLPTTTRENREGEIEKGTNVEV